jgi:uncharacterized protein DUF5946
MPPASRQNSCPECGAQDCQARFEQLLARDFSDARFFGAHRLTVDVYSLQHPERYCASAISLAAHLTGVCAALEHENAHAVNTRVQRWLSTRPVLEKPPLPAQRGEITIADAEPDDPAAYRVALDRWARSTWAAYADLHAIAHAWIAKAC